MKKAFPLVIAVFFLALGLALSLSLMEKDNAPATGPGAELGGPFTLTSDQGPVSLSDFRDKVVALYFGYTHCPDVCITSLTAMAEAMKKLAPEEAAQVQPLFVTIDPERDDAKRVGQYARHFHPRGIGLTGTAAEIAKVAKQYVVVYAKVAMEDSAMGYAMDHSSVIYLIGKDGRLLTLVHHGDTPEAMAQYMRDALQGKGTLVGG